MKFYFRDMEGYKDLTEHQKKYVGKSAVFDLALLPVVTLQEEMAEFIQERIRTVAMTTLLNDRGNYNLLCRFLEKRGKGLEHFLDWDRETWFRKLKAWMLEEGIPLNYERQGNYGNTYRMRPGVMGYVERLLDFLEPEDGREEKEKDIWELEKLGVPVLREKADVAKLAAYDVVICATGSLPIIPNIPGVEKPIAVDCLSAINGAKPVGKKIVVIGGGLVGTETALDLAENGHSVTLVEMLPKIMRDVAFTDYLAYTERIEKTDMRILTDTRLEEVLDNGARVSSKKGEEIIEADTVILALGLKAEQGLYNELIAAGKEAYLVGDAVKAGKIFDAIHTAYRAAIRI